SISWPSSHGGVSMTTAPNPSPMSSTTAATGLESGRSSAAAPAAPWLWLGGPGLGLWLWECVRVVISSCRGEPLVGHTEVRKLAEVVLGALGRRVGGRTGQALSDGIDRAVGLKARVNQPQEGTGQCLYLDIDHVVEDSPAIRESGKIPPECPHVVSGQLAA